MFTRFYDPETCELLDGDAIHPFALASKMHNEDFPTFREILRLPEEEKQKWMESMDEELKALYKFKMFEFVDLPVRPPAGDPAPPSNQEPRT